MAGKHFTLADLPPRYLAEVERQLAGGKPLGQARAQAVGSVQVEIVAPKSDSQTTKRIQQHQGDGCNKWEREYKALIMQRWPDCFLHREVALPLANGVKYKLDWLRVIRTDNGCDCIGFEVKGVARSTGIVKIKVAASLYPWISFRLVTKRRKKDGGGWAEEEVLP